MFGVFTFGICQAGGAGKVLAEWVTEGATEWDMWSCDPRRFTGFEDPDYCVKKGMEVYGHEYAIHFPHHSWPEGRMKRLSAVHDRTAVLGAQFGPYNGWERALWYARPGDDTSGDAQRTWDREGPWFGAVREECEAVRDACGILDLPGFSRFRVTGAGTVAWLSAQITGKVPNVGRLGLAYFSDEKGRIVTEMSVARIAEDEVLLITAATAQVHDREWLLATLPKGLSLVDESEAWSTQILTGPKARDVLVAAGAEADLTKGWLTWQNAQVAGREVFLMRVSFAGELGWEIHSRVEDTPAVWEILLRAGRGHGLRPFGMFISFGNASGKVLPFDLGILGAKGSLKITRPTLFTHTADPVACQQMARDLFNKVASGAVKIRIDQRFPLDRVADAHRALEARETTGSTILTLR
jgi:dimethylglycine dehydrogenase